jgi:hypothetical protein
MRYGSCGERHRSPDWVRIQLHERPGLPDDRQAYDTDYVDYWLAALSITRDQREVVDLYTVLYCLDFLSEFGQRFNKEVIGPVPHQQIAHLTHILDALLVRFGA